MNVQKSCFSGVMFAVGSLSQECVYRSLRRKRHVRSRDAWSEIRDRLTILVIVGTRRDEHSLRSQVGIGSESHCLFGQLDRIRD